MVERSYRADKITVRWNSELCIHTAVCLNALPQVFDVKARPWIAIEDASAFLEHNTETRDRLDKVLKKSGWNSYVIRATGNHITLSINGLTTVDYRETDKTVARNGIIALQLHSGPAMRIEFRNIRLRPLKSP